MMSLEKYRRSRLVVQKPETSAHDAARAMEANRVGAILVKEDGELCGIVTDRDLALRVAGQGKDAHHTPLRAIMSRDLATLSIWSHEDRAIELMRIRHVRRIPLLENDELVGLVTLDDIILESQIKPSRIAEVILTQLQEPAQHKPALATHPESQPRKPRNHQAEERFGRLLHRVQAATQLPTREHAEKALEVVLAAIVRRITYQEASDLIAQLPSKIQGRLLDLPKGPDRSINLVSIANELSRRLETTEERAVDIARDVVFVVEHAVSAGEIEDVRAQLPPDIRQLFSPI